MRILHYDCFAGISGDMNLGAMADLGADTDELVSELKKLGLPGWRIEFTKDSRGGIYGMRADVVCDDAGGGSAHGGGHAHAHAHGHPHAPAGRDAGHAGGLAHAHRTFAEIRRIIDGSALDPSVKRMSVAIFSTIANAEAKVHGKQPDEVHFHEVGALDSIIDIVGAAVCAKLLGADKFTSSAVELGGGTVRCAHGLMPVPAPATAEISRAFPSKIGGAPHECTTPTGAAIIATLCSSFSPEISGRITACGTGIGHRDSPGLPNVLRAMIIETDEAPGTRSDAVKSERMSLLEANIDDMAPEHLALLQERLFEAGASDAWQEAIVMKKGRLASKVCALCRPETSEKVGRAFFLNSRTLGIRRTEISRDSIARECFEAHTPLGRAAFKVSEFGGIRRIKPEFESCKKISSETGLPADVVSERLGRAVGNGEA